MNIKAQHPDITQNLNFRVDANQVIYGKKGSCYLRLKLWLVFLLLVNNKDRIVNRTKIIDEVWNGNYYTGPKALTHSICKLRTIFKELEVPVKIKTCPKQGYVLRLNDSLPCSKKTSTSIKEYTFFPAEYLAYCGDKIVSESRLFSSREILGKALVRPHDS